MCCATYSITRAVSVRRRRSMRRRYMTIGVHAYATLSSRAHARIDVSYPTCHTNGNRDAPGARPHCSGYDVPPCMPNSTAALLHHRCIDDRSAYSMSVASMMVPLHCCTIGTSMIAPHNRCQCCRWLSASRRDRGTTMTASLIEMRVLGKRDHGGPRAHGIRAPTECLLRVRPGWLH